MHPGFSPENLKKIYHLEETGVGGRITEVKLSVVLIKHHAVTTCGGATPFTLHLGAR
jgi:hypothetical protein